MSEINKIKINGVEYNIDDTSKVSSVNNKTGSVTLNPSDIGLGTVFNLKGSKSTVSGLPSSGNIIGDVWYVIDESVGYIWLNDGSVDRWEKLGLPIDLSNYVSFDELQGSHNHDDRYFTETEIDDKIKYGYKTLYEGTTNSVYVEYVVVGEYKVVTLFYYRNGGKMTIPTGITTLATTILADAWKPTHQIQIPYAKAVIVLQTDGTINIYCKK